jgi:hypothetical protein
MLSKQEEKIERMRVFAQDQSLRTGTYLSHTHDDIHQGRFAAIGRAQVVGATAVPQYPAAGPHQSDPCGPEPSLGYRIDDMAPLEQTSLAPPVAQGNSGDADVPSPSPLCDAAAASSSFSSGDPAADSGQSRSPSDGYVVSPGPFRRRV